MQLPSCFRRTPKTLGPFDGKDGRRILLAINGIVTAGRGVLWTRYAGVGILLRLKLTRLRCGSGGNGNFAGRHASQGMAEQSLLLRIPLSALHYTVFATRKC